MAPHKPGPQEEGEARVLTIEPEHQERGAGQRGVGELPAIDESELLERLAGDAALAGDLLQLFVDESAPMLVRMRDALSRGDLGAVAREAHSLKGAAAYVSAVASRQIADALEAAALQGRSDAALALLDPLAQALHRLRAVLG